MQIQKYKYKHLCAKENIEHCPLTAKWWCMRGNLSPRASSVPESVPMCTCKILENTKYKYRNENTNLNMKFSFLLQNFVFFQKGIFCSLRLFLHIRRMSLEWWKFLWEQDLYNSMILRRGFVGNWEEHLYDVDLKERNICMILRRGFVAGQTDVSPPVFRLPAPSCAADTWRTHCKAPGRDTRHKNTETQLWNTWHTWRTQHDDDDWDETDNDDYDDDCLLWCKLFRPLPQCRWWWDGVSKLLESCKSPPETSSYSCQSALATKRA